MSATIPAERQQQILEILKKNKAIRVNELSGILGVSEMTVRRDLDALSMRGLLRRTHGGAMVKPYSRTRDYRFDISSATNMPEKRRIAKQAASMIEPGDVVFVCDGSTTAEILPHLDPEMNCTIITNNIALLNHAASVKAEVVMLGGTFDRETLALTGLLTVEAIGRVHANKAFLGVDGISLSKGMTDAALKSAIVARSMLEQTLDQVICMVDHSKFDLVGSHVVAPLNKADFLISDDKMPQDYRRELSDLQVISIIA